MASRTPSPVLEEAQALHDDALVIDLHSDAFLWRRLIRYDIWRRHSPLPLGSPILSHVDVPRLREGGVAAQGFGIVTSPIGGRGLRAVTDALRDLSRHPDRMVPVERGSDIPGLRRQGKMAGFFGIEGAHALGGRIDRVASLRTKGVLYIGLVHLTSGPAGHPGNRLRMSKKGITRFAADLIVEMEHQGVIVDLAHLNRKGFLQATGIVGKPVIVSHTGIAEVHPLWRNIDATQIRAVAETGGVIGVIFYPGFLTGRPRCHIDAIVDHIEAIRRYGGIETAALGSDFDGCIPSLPEGLSDAASLPRITEALLRRGFRDGEIRKVLGENALRVLTEVCG